MSFYLFSNLNHDKFVKLFLTHEQSTVKYINICLIIHISTNVHEHSKTSLLESETYLHSAITGINLTWPLQRESPSFIIQLSIIILYSLNFEHNYGTAQQNYFHRHTVTEITQDINYLEPCSNAVHMSTDNMVFNGTKMNLIIFVCA